MERSKHMIKNKGHGVFPADFEDVLTQPPAVRECAVVGCPEDITGGIPLAFVISKEGAAASDQEPNYFYRDKIGPYKRIQEVRFIKELPKTLVGKILKRRLRAMI